jgi:hypothetical protein
VGSKTESRLVLECGRLGSPVEARAHSQFAPLTLKIPHADPAIVQGLFPQHLIAAASPSARNPDSPSEAAMWKPPNVPSLLLRNKAERPQFTQPIFGTVIVRYEQEEMPTRRSTSIRYRSNIENRIRPRWADTPVNQFKPMTIEAWLKTLKLAPKTKARSAA